MKAYTARERAKDTYLQKHYCITLAEYKRIWNHQGGKCAMCRRPESDFSKGFAVDHDHKTGLIRGLLCWLCNKKLGKFQDDDVLVRSAAEYVTSPPATAVLGTPRHSHPGRVGSDKRNKLCGITPRKKKTKGRSGSKGRATKAVRN